MDAEMKVQMLTASRATIQSIRDMQTLFKTATPMATQLVVWTNMEKLLRAADKVQQGLQELV